MSDATRGRLFVAAQLLLLGAICVPLGSGIAPDGRHLAGLTLIAAGVALFLLSGTRLGRALTATPVPRDGAGLCTTGPYAHVRHPIYTALLLLVLGVALRSTSPITWTLAAAALPFFHAKAAFEERLLAERYPDYPAYAARTPRFVPRLSRPPAAPTPPPNGAR